MSVVTVRRAAGAAAADRGRGRRARFPLGLRAVVFQVADGRITAVTEYCDTTAMKRILFAA